MSLGHLRNFSWDEKENAGTIGSVGLQSSHAWEELVTKSGASDKLRSSEAVQSPTAMKSLDTNYILPQVQAAPFLNHPPFPHSLSLEARSSPSHRLIFNEARASGLYPTLTAMFQRLYKIPYAF
ncbi:hypothetical protein BP5796_04396 [Coleophoma crateriformis]|uniref:Uncharacterized protein n=1 Tax=Coleophoma crateriformis TaxID=565419 RepID=A0A3D8S972_9HELO|nr:hypothetical protein BP5796_04396 [Coleophoma crateriformis]